MVDWQERITSATDPAIRVEHDVRYALAVPLIRRGGLWADLGCGNGVAAADALGEEPVERALLVDVDEAAAQEAARIVPAREATPLRADLAEAGDLERVREALAGASGTITCFETVEHLKDFVPVIEALVELSERFTVLLSVPNDAFWALENPYHETRWGEGAFAELRTLLPEGHVVVHQVSLDGSAVAPTDGAPEEIDLRASVSAAGVPTHYLAAFGPAAGEVATGGRVVQTDLDERRRWERQRASDLEFLRVANERLQAEVDKQRNDLREIIAERDDFRRYIHELEHRLGAPLSGGGEQEQPAALPPA